jgi:hypothetical protein
MLGHALIALLDRESKLLLRHSGKCRGQRGRRTCVSTVHVGGVTLHQPSTLAQEAATTSRIIRSAFRRTHGPARRAARSRSATAPLRLRARAPALQQRRPPPLAPRAATARPALLGPALGQRTGDYRPASVFWIIEMLAVASRIAGADAHAPSSPSANAEPARRGTPPRPQRALVGTTDHPIVLSERLAERVKRPV